MAEIKVVQGNDFWLQIDVTKKIIGGDETEAFPLDSLTDRVVKLVNLGGITLSTILDTTTAGRMYAHCVNLPIGSYKLVLTGNYQGNAVRSAEAHMVTIVDRNSQGNTPSGAYAGEDSYNIDLVATLYGNVIAIDDVPTENSTNAVSSGGVYDCLANKADAKTRVVIYLNSDNTIAGIGGDDIKYDGTCEFLCTYMGQATTLSFPLTYKAGGYRENPCLKGLFFIANTATLYKVIIDDVTEGASASVTQITTQEELDALQEELNALQEEIDTKQDKLIAGANITIADDGKTISATGGGGSVTTDTAMSDTSTNPVQNKVIKSYVDTALADKADAVVVRVKSDLTTDKTSSEIFSLITKGASVYYFVGGYYYHAEFVDPEEDCIGFTKVVDNKIYIYQHSGSKLSVSNKAYADASTTYTKTEVNTALSAKLDSSAISNWAKASTKPNYEASEIGAEGYDNVQSAIGALMMDIGKKADASTTYTKTQVDSALSVKADESEVTELSLKVSSIETEIGDINTILTSI